MSQAILVAVASVAMALPLSVVAQDARTENDPPFKETEYSAEWKDHLRKEIEYLQSMLQRHRDKGDWAEHKHTYDYLRAALYCGNLEGRGVFTSEEMATLRKQLEFERAHYADAQCHIPEKDEILVDPSEPVANYRQVATSEYVEPSNASKAVRDRAALYKRALVDANLNGNRVAVQQLLLKFRKLSLFASQRLENWADYSAITRELIPKAEVLADRDFVSREYLLAVWAAAQPRECVKQSRDCLNVELPCVGEMMKQGEAAGGCKNEFSDCEATTEDWLRNCDPLNSITGITVAVADMFGPEGLRIIPTQGVIVRVLDTTGQEIASTTTQNAIAADFVSLSPGKYILRLDIGEYEPALPPQCTDGYVRNIELSQGEHKRYAASVYSATVASNGQSVGTVSGECIKEQ